MPQINQLADVAYSQFFWLLLTLALIYFGIGKAMLPRIQSTVEARDGRIAGDLEAARLARTAADETEAAYRARIEQSRGEALRVTQAAKQASAREAEERVRAEQAGIEGRIADAEARIRTAAEAAMGEVEAVAAEAAQQMVDRIAGIPVSRERALEAVRMAAADV